MHVGVIVTNFVTNTGHNKVTVLLKQHIRTYIDYKHAFVSKKMKNVAYLVLFTTAPEEFVLM